MKQFTSNRHPGFWIRKVDYFQFEAPLTKFYVKYQAIDTVTSSRNNLLFDASVIAASPNGLPIVIARKQYIMHQSTLTEDESCKYAMRKIPLPSGHTWYFT